MTQPKNSKLLLEIQKAQNGNQESFRILEDSYKPLIESCSYKRVLPDMTSQDIEDLRQEALVHFCNAVCSYGYSADGVEFGLYAKICIDNGLVSFIRSYLRRSNNKTVSLDSCEVADETAGRSSDFLQALVDRENMTEMVSIIKDSLSEYENRVWWLYVSGMSVADIAAAVGGVSAKSVSNAVYRIRKKLRGLYS